jgi:hypothetical protein
MPRSAIVYGFFSREVDIGEFNDDLETPLTKFLPHIKGRFRRKARFEFVGFWQYKLSDTILPLLKSFVVIVFVFVVFLLRLLVVRYIFRVWVIDARLIYDPWWDGEIFLKRRERHVPQWNNFGYYLLDNSIQVLVVSRVEIINVARYSIAIDKRQREKIDTLPT